MAVRWSQPLLDELALWFVLQHSVSAYTSLIRHFGNATLALRAGVTAWQQLGLHHAHPKKLKEWQNTPALAAQFEQAIGLLDHPADHILRLDDPAYPKQLAHIADPPPFLFVRGNPQQLNQPQIAMVGSRKPTQTGYKIAVQFANRLAEQGFGITSGLAHGIDAAAHQGALQAGHGQTIAVMGTGTNLCYPSANQGLYWQIIENGGAVLSEFMPGTAAREYHFPRRNRIVSGLSLGVLVVEAALKSGSLITAQTALEQNRQVFAIPGHIYSEQSRGCHQLIRDGALLVDEPQQVVDELDLPRRWHCQDMPVTALAEQITSVEIMHSSTETAAKKQPKAKQPKTKQHNQAALDLVTLPPSSAPLSSTPVPLANLSAVASNLPVMIVPDHLQALYQHLDWVGISLDHLVEITGTDVATLSSQLMEMELLGFAVQQAGLYQRCRQ